MAVTLALLLVSCTARPAPPSGSPPSETSTTPSSPTPTRAPSQSVVVTAVPSIPKDFLYVESSPIRDVTLWLVDLSSAAAPVPVARWTSGNGSFAASRDGKTILVVSPSPRSNLALHLVRPLTGEATVLFDPHDGRRVFDPRLSPDGTTFAFRALNDLGVGGIQVGDVATGAVRELAGTPGTSVVPFGFSDDGQWIGFFQDAVGGTGCCAYVENLRDGRRIDVGSATVLSWRASEPRLLVSKQDRTGHQGAFGATVSTFDLSQQRRTSLLSIDPRINQIAWHPTKDEFFYVQETVGCNYHGTVWTSALSGPAKRIGAAESVQSAWWSADGSTIYALVLGVAPDSLIIDAATGSQVAVIPNDAPRPCP